MSQFLESIKILNCLPINLTWHQARVNYTFQNFFPESTPWDLTELINPKDLRQDLTYKCRFTFNNQLRKIEYLPYTSVRHERFKLIDIGDYEYQFKYSDRSFFQHLAQANPNYDQLILIRHGLVTDCTYANLVFENQKGFYTPRIPLLPGVLRAKLLATGKLQLADIRPKDLEIYQNFYLINALIGEDLKSPYSIKLIDRSAY